MKIMILKKDYVRLFVISKKLEPKNLDKEDIYDLKVTYYFYLVEYYNHENKPFDIAHCYL